MEALPIFTGVYSLYSLYDYQKKIKSLKNNNKYKNIIISEFDNIDGINLNEIKENMHMPIYVSIGNSHVSFPIGGGDKYNTEEFLYSKFLVDNKKLELENYTCIDNPSKKYYINTSNDLNNLFNRYNIDSTKLLVKLPIQAEEYNLKKPVFTITNNNLGIISNNRNELIKVFSFRTRLPLSFTMGVTCISSCIYLYNKY